jgi:hypothetical protein
MLAVSFGGVRNANVRQIVNSNTLVGCPYITLVSMSASFSENKIRPTTQGVIDFGYVRT